MFITYLSTQQGSIRGHQVKYITEERQNWRISSNDKTNEMKEIKTFIALSLNPCDDDEDKDRFM